MKEYVKPFSTVVPLCLSENIATSPIWYGKDAATYFENQALLPSGTETETEAGVDGADAGGGSLIPLSGPNIEITSCYAVFPAE